MVNFCPGSGATFGNGVVEHPKTRYIAFTGSKEVGLDINERAAKTAKGQIWIKRTVLEMGGKDSIVVDADAEHRFRRGGRDRGGVRLPGTEVLGLLARDRPPGGL